MTSIRLCEHCSHYEEWHVEGVRCSLPPLPLKQLGPCDCPGFELKTKWKSLISQVHLQAIGLITVNFAQLEDVITDFISDWIGNDSNIGKIVTAELSFRNLVALLSSLFRETAEKEATVEELDSLLKKALLVEEKRNIITHSIWTVGKTESTITRVKRTAKVGKGLRQQKEQLTVDYLLKIADQIAEVAYEINIFHDEQMQ